MSALQICFYNVLYGILFSFLISLFLLRKEKNIFDFLGIKALGKKQVFILVVFIAFSVGGQIIPTVAKGGIIPWDLLPMGIVPLIMTPFFEEFFILLLFAVGIGFAAAYKLSGNNLIVAYFVNLPNAFVTYMLKFEQFPKMTIASTMAGIVTLCIIVVVFIVLVRANRKER